LDKIRFESLPKGELVAKVLISIVAPVFNEEQTIREFYSRLAKTLSGIDANFEILIVNDGSSDGSEAILEELRATDSRIRPLHFSRNFGHQIAMKAGLDHAKGDAVVVIDSDLQDPPEAIPQLIEKWRDGYDVVYTVHKKRAGETLFKKITASVYYRLLVAVSSVQIPQDAGDFRLLSRRVVEVLRPIEEKNPYWRGLIAWVGFKQTSISIDRDARFAGRSKYSLKKMLRLAWHGLLHFSLLPLKLPFCFAGILLTLAVAFFAACVATWTAGNVISVWIPALSIVFLLAGLQFVCIGILGSYVALSYQQANHRPVYILKDASPSK